MHPKTLNTHYICDNSRYFYSAELKEERIKKPNKPCRVKFKLRKPLNIYLFSMHREKSYNCYADDFDAIVSLRGLPKIIIFDLIVKLPGEQKGPPGAAVEEEEAPL